ncbi:MAG: transposase [Candidatus Binatia bacterium]
MPRTLRLAPGDWIFHTLNRANGAGDLFDSPSSYSDFLQLVEDAAELISMRVLAYCAMPNHWHMLLWPRGDGDLSTFVQHLTSRHTQRWHARHGSAGRGHVYQGRFKSFPVRDDHHLVTVCRYIERNPVRAGLVSRAELWPWSSAAAHADQSRSGNAVRREIGRSRGNVSLTPLPIGLPPDWPQLLHNPQTEAELEAMRTSLRRDLPYGDTPWQQSAAARLGLERGPRGRPRKNTRPID